MKNLKVYQLIVAIIIVTFLAGCNSTSAQNSQPTEGAQNVVIVTDDLVSASAKVVATKYANLSFMVGAQEFTLFVNAGDEVKKGDRLAVLSDDFLPQNIILAEADLLSAQRALADLLKSETARYQAERAKIQAEIAVDDAQADLTSITNPRASDTLIEKTKAEIDLARKVLEDAEEAYDKVDTRDDGDELKASAILGLTNARLRLRELDLKLNWYLGTTDPLDVKEKEAALSLAKAALADAEREYERLKEGPDPDDVAAANAKVKALESVINQKNLIAPFDGTIVEVYSQSGETISPGVPVMLLADLSSLQIQTTDLTEVDVARVKIGDTVKVSFDALPGVDIPGKVIDIALKNASGSGVYYKVTIALDETPEQLRWGMSAFVEIKITE